MGGERGPEALALLRVPLGAAGSQPAAQLGLLVDRHGRPQPSSSNAIVCAPSQRNVLPSP